MINLRSTEIPQGSQWFVAAAEIVSDFIRAIWNKNKTNLIKILLILITVASLRFYVLSSSAVEKIVVTDVNIVTWVLWVFVVTQKKLVGQQLYKFHTQE